MKRILLIEDEDELIELYREVFKRSGFELECLKLGFEALERLEEIKKGKLRKPDLILLDLILLDISGLDILEKAKKEKETKDIPFFVFTNYTDEKLKEEGEKLGADKYLVKTDITPHQLLKLIREYLKK